jgi:hypothetical protein
MRQRIATVSEAALVVVGPMIWAAHFFLVYLAEAVLCSPAVAADGAVRAAGGALTIAAIVALVWARATATRHVLHALARPLVDLSIAAVVLTAIPLLIISSCRPA